MKLNTMEFDNFKGIKHREIDFSDRTIISGENGAGKTTVYDAFQWLLFGKDSEGRSDFNIRPLDKDNNPIKGLVIAVQADIEIDGTSHTFRKEEKQKYDNKGKLKGNNSIYEIDKVPKLAKDFKAYIDEIVTEDVFKMLTSLKHFLADKEKGGIHWEKRRDVLLNIAGDIGTPEGFDELLAILNGRTQKEYKKVLNGQKKKLEEKQAEVPTRIDELQKQLSEYAAEDTVELENKRGILEIEVRKLDTQRQDILDKEDARQDKLTKLNILKGQRIDRATELRNDTSGVKAFLNEKAELEREVAATEGRVEHAVGMLTMKIARVDSKKSEIELKTQSRAAIRREYDEVEKLPIRAITGMPEDEKCPWCAQDLPPEKLGEIEEKQQAELKNAKENKTLTLGGLAGQGKRVHKEIQKLIEELGLLEAEATGATSKVEAAKKERKIAWDKRAKRLPELDELIKDAGKIDPESDKVWVNLNDSINKLAAEIGEPASDQLSKINEQRNTKANELEKVKTALSQSDQAAKNKERIAELEDREKELAQQIADIDKQLKDIADYKTEESNLLLEAVNGKFKHVEFKLFNELVNGEIEDCCEAMLNGTPYSGMSSGEEIFAGIDIVNVLSEHYGVSIPLFIDHAESLTLPIEAKSQVIELRAVEGLTELTVESKE